LYLARVETFSPPAAEREDEDDEDEVEEDADFLCGTHLLVGRDFGRA